MSLSSTASTPRGAVLAAMAPAAETLPTTAAVAAAGALVAAAAAGVDAVVELRVIPGPPAVRVSA
eukprot:3631827-Lingulodinium_polyedra.AAC.1